MRANAMVPMEMGTKPDRFFFFGCVSLKIPLNAVNPKAQAQQVDYSALSLSLSLNW